MNREVENWRSGKVEEVSGEVESGNLRSRTGCHLSTCHLSV